MSYKTRCTRKIPMKGPPHRKFFDRHKHRGFLLNAAVLYVVLPGKLSPFSSPNSIVFVVCVSVSFLFFFLVSTPSCPGQYICWPSRLVTCLLMFWRTRHKRLILRKSFWQLLIQYKARVWKLRVTQTVSSATRHCFASSITYRCVLLLNVWSLSLYSPRPTFFVCC